MYNQPEVALEKYELTVSRIIKGRGAYICLSLIHISEPTRRS